jgi:hypothetical protein
MYYAALGIGDEGPPRGARRTHRREYDEEDYDFFQGQPIPEGMGWWDGMIPDCPLNTDPRIELPAELIRARTEIVNCNSTETARNKGNEAYNRKQWKVSSSLSLSLPGFALVASLSTFLLYLHSPFSSTLLSQVAWEWFSRSLELDNKDVRVWSNRAAAAIMFVRSRRWKNIFEWALALDVLLEACKDAYEGKKPFLSSPRRFLC